MRVVTLKHSQAKVKFCDCGRFIGPMSKRARTCGLVSKCKWAAEDRAKRNAQRGGAEVVVVREPDVGMIG